MNIKTVNPSSKELLGIVPITSNTETDTIVDNARKAFKKWKEKSLADRITCLKNLKVLIEENKEEIAELESKEMGKPINDALEGVDGDIEYIKWNIENAGEYLSPEKIKETDTSVFEVFKEPYGVFAAITPWNFPLGNTIWATVQPLLAGNVVILKPSEEVPMSVYFIINLYKEVFPEHVIQIVIGKGEQGDYLTDQDIDFLSFTGSTKTGQYLHKKAGNKFIKSTMELGGSAPAIVFKDCDISSVVTAVAEERLYNCGQVCDGLKRLFVHSSHYENTVKKLIEIFQKLKVGNSLDPGTEVGPLASEKQLKVLQKQVEESVAMGATIETGGKVNTDLSGYFFEPTILTNVTPDMPVMKEEVFGPVLPITSFETEDEAIDLANYTSYGLGAFIYSNDNEQIERVSKKLLTGMVSVNGVSYIDPACPFGGYKESGLGREHGKFGFDEVTQVKIVAKPK